MSKRKTKEEWQNLSDEIYNKEFILLDDPKNAHEKINILHKKCGNILYTSTHNHTKRYCAYCSNKKRKSIDELQILSNKIHNGEFIILEEPKNIKTNIKILHKKCNKILKMTMNNHINHKNGCKDCSKYSLKSKDY